MKPTDDISEYLKDGESVIDCIKRNRGDVYSVLTLLAKALERAEKAETALDADINEIVSRFLRWKLPKTFNPDNGVHFDPPSGDGMWPSGTNILNANEATEMVRYIINLPETL